MHPTPDDTPAGDPTDDRSDWSRWPDFRPAELRCRGTGLLLLHPGFLDALQALRLELDRPMAITSGCRSAAHNRAVGGHPRSLHICDAPQHPGQLGCLAVDVAARDGAFRGRLFAAAWTRGWSVGWGRGFLHLDRRDRVGLPQTSFDY